MRSSGRSKIALLTAAVVLTSGATWAGASGSDDSTVRSATSSAFGVTAASSPPPTLFYIAGGNFATLETTNQIAPNGRSLVGISAEGDHGLPDIAKAAYQRAARSIEKSRPGCNLPWTLLAGIGRVESDHGRYGGSVLGVDGYPRPRIRGVALNGVGPVAAIRDSDNGKLDGDKVWDRAVGPMQFIPTTWAVSGRDGDGDGVSDPNDIDDAALAAAGYLCPASGSIDSEAAKRTAVFSYNRSDYYVDLVLAFARGYQTGDFTLPSPPVPEPEAPEEVVEARTKPEPGDKAGDRSGGKSDGSKGETSSGSTEAAGSSNSGTTSSGGSKGGKTGGGTTGGSSGSGGGTKNETPTEPPEPTEPPKETLELRAVSGAWTGCPAGWCLSGGALDLGSGGQLDRTALADLDGDGAVESYRAEFTGMTGTVVTVHVKAGTNIVYIVKGVGYRNRDGSFA
ncbi:hypothetical protein GCM10027020_23010 [Nocardioides salsibiostraticola]